MTKIFKESLIKPTAAAMLALAVQGGDVLLTESSQAYAQARVSGSLEEITVTARRIEESLQDLPVSVTAITGDQFKDAGLTEFSDIASLTPNFDVRVDGVTGALFANLTIRGQTTTSQNVNSDQAVGININGAPVTRGTNLFSNLFDIEQIEILRGPQGTLFGKNTTGGTVIVRTTTPKLDEWSGYAEVDFGNFGRNDYELVGNIPIGEHAALRLGGSLTNRDGFGEGINADGILTGNELDDDNEEFYKASFLYEPNDSFSMRINADYHEVEEGGSIHRVLVDGVIFGFFQIATQTPGDNIYYGSDLQSGSFFPDGTPSIPNITADETNINATLKWDLGPVTLESITAYRDQESGSISNYAPSALIRLDQDSDIFSQELRLSGEAFNDRLQWQAGIFLSDEEGVDVDDVGGFRAVTAAENETQSIFAQGTYALNDRTKVTLGIRYTDEDRSIEDVSGNAAGASDFAEESFDDISYLASIDYKFNDSFLGYASVARGFRSGALFEDTIGVVVEPEIVLNFEVGFKGDFLDNTLRWNTSFWHSDYSDIQLQSFDPAGATTQGVPVQILRNAAEATLYGFESELTYIPTDNLTFAAAIGYTHGEFDEFLEADTVNIGQVIDSSGNPIGGPEWQANLLARYEFPVSDKIAGGFQMSYTYLDSQELEDAATIAPLPIEAQDIDSIDLVNAQLDFETESGWNVALYSNNLFDEEYFSSGFVVGVFGLSLAQRIVGAPRTYGIRIRKDF